MPSKLEELKAAAAAANAAYVAANAVYGASVTHNTRHG